MSDQKIAYLYEELPVSNLPVGRGSMPGKPYQELEKKDNLISGRGLVP